MTNTQRNTTVLSVLLTIIIIVGALIVNKQKKQVDTLRTKNSEFVENIAKFDKILAMKDKIDRDYNELKLMLAQQSKVIAQTDTPAITYNYLLQILKWLGHNINFNFSISANKSTDTTWNEYVLSGISDYRLVESFIKQLEYQRVLLTLEEITIDGTTSSISDSVAFSIVFRTHISPDGALVDIIQQKDVPNYKSSFVAFRPRMYNIPSDTDDDPSLVKIDKVKLIGITENRVFLRDDRGLIHILSVGDRVSSGYLYSINPTQEKVVFRLNLFGSTEDKTLYLMREN